MSSDRRRTCQRCRKHESEVGPISWRGKCIACAQELQEANIEGMATRSGEPFKRWRRAMAASVGGVLLDDARVNTQTDGRDA